MSNTRHTILLAAVLCAAAAPAQNLQKEITVQRTVNPDERPAQRPRAVSPQAMDKKPNPVVLELDEYTGTVTPTPSMTRLEPVAWGDTIALTPWRGYLAAGYLPAFNAGVAAGYRFVNRSELQAGAWLNYNGATWKGYTGMPRLHDHTLAMGGDLAKKLGTNTLTASLRYRYGNVNAPGAYEPTLYKSQHINDIALNTGWAGTIGHDTRYKARLDVSHFAFGNDDPMPSMGAWLDPLKETVLDLGGCISWQATPSAVWALDAYTTFKKDNHLQYFVPRTDMWGDGASTPGEPRVTLGRGGSDDLEGYATFTPSLDVNTGNIHLRLGARLDINYGNIRDNGLIGLNSYDAASRLYIAPDAALDWTPSSNFAMYLTATGGERLNTLASLWDANPWMSGASGADRTHINADIRLGFNLGQWRGLFAGAWASWSKADRLYVPVTIDGNNTWAASGCEGFHFGAHAGYALRDILTVKATVEGGQQGCYYLWTDMAKLMARFTLTVKPVQPLAIEAGWHIRTDRYGWALSAQSLGQWGYWQGQTVDLGNASNLHAGARWTLTPQWTLFADIDNILSHHHQYVPGVRSKGINGLVGFEVKF